MAAPRRLRIVVPRYGPLVVGGSEGLARRLATALASRDWQVEVWSTTAIDEDTWRGDLPATEQDGAVSVRRFPLTAHRSPGAFHQASRVFWRLPPRPRPERWWLRGQGPYSPSLIRALATAPAGPTLFTPYLYHPTVYGLPAAPHPRILIPAAHDERPLRLRAVGRMLRAADGLWYGTPEEKELVESVHPGTRATRHAIGTVGVEPSGSADPARFRARFGLTGPYLLYGGRLTAGKGLTKLVDGFQLLRSRRPEAELLLAGEDAADGLGDGIRSLGRLDDRTWADAVAGARAVIVPSRMESLSLLALEAWAAGRPCLLNAASPVLRGQAERSGGALLFASPEELAQAGEQLIDDAERADQLGQAGRAYVAAHYRWDGAEARLLELIDAGQPR
jgi:glycosyltransferase involved in cell wall biosynthesis